jgi:hypothetical protein
VLEWATSLNLPSIARPSNVTVEMRRVSSPGARKKLFEARLGVGIGLRPAAGGWVLPNDDD